MVTLSGAGQDDRIRDHSTLNQLAQHVATLVAIVESLRPAANRAMLNSFPEVWRELRADERYYQCGGWIDLWGTLQNEPKAVRDFNRECNAEDEAYALFFEHLLHLRLEIEYNTD